jgi:cyclopropane fatty-acyl-phospholipid synthase-like methyltransferase
MSLLELGCGNGRYSLFLVEKGKKVQALDLSSKTIYNLFSLKIKNAEFLNVDFSNLTKFSDLDYVYSRFTSILLMRKLRKKVLVNCL